MGIALGNGLISRYFKELGVFEFEAACDWVRGLPYQRNSTKEDCLIVLKESRGTCSSKHELIKRLSEENDINDCKLVLCMFKMSGQNTSKVQSVLANFRLNYIPEAHTYITIGGVMHDLTFPENPELLYRKDILFTEEITADQIKSYKVERHKKYLKEWINKLEVPYTLEEIWEIREKCIASLS